MSRISRRIRRIGPRLRVAAVLGILGTVVLGAAPEAGADKYAGEFLKLPVGARALGMGSAFVALADDATAVYWNPAGLVFAPKRQAWAEHAEQFGDLVNHDFLAYEQPLSATGSGHSQAIGFGFLRSAVDDIVIRDKDPDELVPGPPDQGGEFEDLDGDGKWDPETERLYIENIPFYIDSEAEMAFLFSYARNLGRPLIAGLTAKVIRQSLPGNSSLGIGADLGFLYLPTSTLTLGLKVSDVTTTLLSWDSGRRETIVPSVTLGGQYTRAFDPLRGVLTFAGDMDVTFDNRQAASGVTFGDWVLGADLHGGIEYWYARTVALRLGATTNALTGGGGFRYRDFGIDYAFVGDHPDFDSSHRIGGSYNF